MTRRNFWGTLSAAAGFGQPAKPNILLIMADDLGFSDLGCYGSEIRTPNLDRLAAQGIRLTQFYNNARCCPTRSSLLTGRYPHQVGMGYMEPTHKYARGVTKLGLATYQGYLNHNCATLGEVLRASGYQTFLSGKWHVGKEAGQRPLERGFDRFYGILGGMAPYFRPGPNQIFDGNQPVSQFPSNFYTTDAFTDQAIGFLEERDHAKPWFLYLAFNAPHFNLDAWPEDIERYRGKYKSGWDEIRKTRFERQVDRKILPRGTRLSPRHPRTPVWEDETQKDLMDLKMAVYAAAIDRMDQNIGRLLDFLKRSGQEENTLVVFLSDNGGEMLGRRLDSQPPYTKQDHAFYMLPWANVSNTPFRHFKQMMHEGGISTPFVARWPGRISAGRLEQNQVGHVLDLMPTFLEAAGGQYPQRLPSQEGRSLLGVLTGTGKPFTRQLFWEHGGNRAVRDGRWKLVSYYNEVEDDPVTYGLGPRTGPWELYDMNQDRSEMNDLASKLPGKVRSMEKAWTVWARRAGVTPWEDILKAGDWLN